MLAIWSKQKSVTSHVSHRCLSMWFADELHFTMLFKCKFSIVFIWWTVSVFCHLGSLWFLQTCCFYPQFPFPLTGASAMTQTVSHRHCLCWSLLFISSLQAHFSVVHKDFWSLLCWWFLSLKSVFHYLLSETYVLDSGAELSFVPQVQSGEVRLWTGCLAMFLRPLKKCIQSLSGKRQVPNYQCCSSFEGFVKKITILSSFTHPHVVPNLNDFLLWNTKGIFWIMHLLSFPIHLLTGAFKL